MRDIYCIFAAAMSHIVEIGAASTEQLHLI